MKRNFWVIALIAASLSTSALAKNKESFCTEGTVIAWGPGIHSRDALGSYPDTLVLETNDRVIYLYNWTYGRNYDDRLFLHVNTSLSFCVDGDKATFIDALKRNQIFKVEHIEPK
jgi:hypothetical protein